MLQPAAQEVTRRVAYDRRADDKRRLVDLTEQGVTIERRAFGAKMRIFVPTAAFACVVLSCAPYSGRMRYVVMLVHRDPELSSVLSDTYNRDDAHRLWQHWQALFQLPGFTEGPTDQVLRAALPRRRMAAIANRRPTFTARRAPGAIGRLATIIRGEREIIARR